MPTTACPLPPRSSVSSFSKSRNRPPSAASDPNSFETLGFPKMLTRVFYPTLPLSENETPSPPKQYGWLRRVLNSPAPPRSGIDPAASEWPGFSLVVLEDFSFDPSAFDSLQSLTNVLSPILGSLVFGDMTQDGDTDGDRLRTHLGAHRLRIDFSCDLVPAANQANSQCRNGPASTAPPGISEVKHCLVERRELGSDAETTAFRCAIQRRLQSERLADQAGSANLEGWPDGIILSSLNSLKPQLTSNVQSVQPALTVYVLPKNYNGPLPGKYTDTLTTAVRHLGSDNRLMAAENSPQWLFRLDRASLQRYLNELTENLLGSVESAFAQGDLFSDGPL